MRNAAVLIALAVSAAACSSPAKKMASGSVTLSLDRAAAGTNILVTAHVADDAGAPVAGSPPAITAQGGAVSAVTDAGGGNYTATVTPTAPDTEVVITATANGRSATKTALALAVVDAAWGQPEAVAGLVNTNGWEDGADISPDGQWLLVSSYLPIDLLTCAQANISDTAPSCMTLTGPVAAPTRPDMWGAERVHGTTYDAICPDLGVTQPIGFAFPPTSAYGFHRQPDGSFAEPFVIGFDADGCLGPYGFFLVGAPNGTQAAAVFANDDPQDSPDTHSDVAWTPLTMGQKNVLGTYRMSGSQSVLTGKTFTVLPPVLATRQGNPAFGAGALWWDDEDLAAQDRDLYFAPVTGTLPAITAGSAMTAGVSIAGHEDIQPSLDGFDLYWMAEGHVNVATLTSGADPALAGSWTAPTEIVGPASAAHILAIGEPNVAHVAGTLELYFVYVYKTPTGYDANIGVVRHR